MPKKILFIFFIWILFTLPLWWFVTQWYDGILLQEQRARLTKTLTPQCDTLANEISRRIMIVDVLKSFVLAHEKLHGGIDNAHFNTFAAGMHSMLTGIRLIQLSPGGVNKFVYPLKDNENILGHDLLHDQRPLIRNDIERALQTKRIVLSVPYELRQGGMGLVARLAVYQEGSFWGFAVVIMDLPPILSMAFDEKELGVNVAIRDRNGRVFYGSEETYSSHPIYIPINLPDGEWQLAAIPTTGWRSTIENRLWLFQGTSLLIFVLFSIIGFLVTNHQRSLKRAISERTQELEIELEQRKQKEKELQESEKRYRQLFVTNPQPMWVYDLESLRFLAVNDAAITHYGYSREEFLEMTIKDIRPPEDLSRLLENIAQVDNGLDEAGSWRHIKKDGSLIDVEITSHTLMFDNRRAEMVLVNDITERKRVLGANEKNRKILKLFVEHAPAAIAMFDSQMRYIIASRRYLTDYEIDTQEIIGKSHYEVFTEIPERWKETHRRCLAGTTERCDKDPFLRANGRMDWIRWEILPWHDSEGTIGGIILFSEVITNQVEAANDLKESENKFRELFQKHSAIKLIIDPVDGAIIDANEAAENYYGWNAEQLTGMNINEINVLSADEMQEELEQAKNQQRIYFEFQHRLADGSVRDVAVYSSKIDIKGKSLLHSIIQDVSELKQTERERKELQARLQQAQKMEAIGTLAGGIAHDFNNILGAIIGYAELAKDLCTPGSNIANDLDKVLDAGGRAANLVKQILAFSRQANTEKVALEPRHVAKEALKLLRPALPSTITIKQYFETSKKLIVIDPTQLHQIVMNLVTNAFHAMEQSGGILDISLVDRELSEQDLKHQPGIAAGEFVVLSITDSGSGISPEIKEKIFEPYYTTKEVGKGTGLGLAIVHGIVTSSGGFITCESEIGKGTVFKVFFPAVEGQITSTIEELDADLSEGERILLIDDEDILVEMGQTMLERLGYKVTARTNSIDALVAFQNEPDKFDAVITDQTMPVMTGIDLSRRFLQIRPDIPIILCTGYSSLVNEAQARAVGIKGFAMKPLTKNKLTALLRSVLSKPNHQW